MQARTADLFDLQEIERELFNFYFVEIIISQITVSISTQSTSFFPRCMDIWKENCESKNRIFVG
jgi:hypothetical protein